MEKTTETEVSPNLPTSGQIIGTLVKSLGLNDHRLRSKTARRYFAARLENIVKESSRAEIIDGFADALSELGFRLDTGPERANTTSAIAEMIDWHATHWDRLRSVLLPRMSRVYPSHLAVVWNTYLRLATIDFAFRIASHLRLMNRTLATVEFLRSASVNQRGAYLNQKRENAKISLWDFAEKVGVSNNAVDGWLYRGVRPHDDNLAKIASTLASGSEPSANETILRELRLLYWISDIAESLSEHIGGEASDDIVVRLHDYTSQVYLKINSDSRFNMRLTDIEELAARGSRSPLASPLLSQLQEQETDDEWKEDLYAAGSDWIGRVLSVNYQLHRSEEKALIKESNGQIFENWGINDPRAYEHYLRAMELQNQGRISDAVSELTTAIELDPLDAANHLTLGSVKGGIGIRIGDEALVEEGLQECWTAVSLDSKWIIPWTEIGWLLLGSGRAKEAADHLLSVKPERRPFDSRYYQALAMSFDQLGAYAEALNAFESSLKLNPYEPNVAIGAAVVAFLAGDKRKSSKYRKIARHLGFSNELDRILDLAKAGLACQASIDIARAKDLDLFSLDVTIARRPDDSTALLSRAKAYFVNREDDRAISDLNAVLSIDPGRPGVHLLRGIVYGYMGRYESAIADLSEAISLNPDDAMARYYRGLAYGELDILDLAIGDLNEVIRLTPDNFDAFRARGDCYRYKREYDRAVSDYDTAINLDPEDAASYRGRGSAHRMKHDFDLAIHDLNTAISLDSVDPFAYRFRGDAYFAKGNLDEAIADFDATLKLAPEDEVAYRRRANARLCKGELDLALSDFDAAIACDPMSVFAYEGRRLVREAMGGYHGSTE